MKSLITWTHCASTFFLSLGIVVFARYFLSPVRLSLAQREKQVYVPAFGFFFVAVVCEALSKYFAGKMEDFQQAIALAIFPFLLFLCLSVKCIRRRLTEQGGGNSN